ncbi:helix-turn-helix domain-containing protein [Burkholderia sp. Se-20378]|uniref:helix-turn-helix domain-containing protein n=1 Tax=Burkholderia sp. Se-20378 TaxID=2703899 RepID=UPI0019814D98|nr:helix-turn-helix domain-containing protein [Burkholderia sp. Se-20378]MBN3770715.1 hypothetical protein [Burkholderia sp. Se-20378]
MTSTNQSIDRLTPLRVLLPKSAPPIEAAYSYPEASSVRGRALAALLRGERLTQADALSRWATSRLSSAIYQLRGLGWPIMAVAVPVQTRDNGRTATIARYRLPAFAIKKAGERGQRFVVHAEQYEKQGAQR